MRVLLVGGSGDLGAALSPLLAARGDAVAILDIAEPPATSPGAEFVRGSVLDRAALANAVAGAGAVVHIAAWHGFHEGEKLKDAFDFWDLNMTGTMNVLETMVRAGVRNLVFVSSTSVRLDASFYGHTKILGEQLVAWHARHRGINAAILRPRAFIPPTNRAVYREFSDWAKWFWRGAVHVDDVASAAFRTIDLLARERFAEPPVLPLDGTDDIPDAERAAWDAAGPGTSFRRIYPEFDAAAIAAGLDVGQPPRRIDIAETRRLIGFEPKYGVRQMLRELSASHPS